MSCTVFEVQASVPVRNKCSMYFENPCRSKIRLQENSPKVLDRNQEVAPTLQSAVIVWHAKVKRRIVPLLSPTFAPMLFT